MKIGYLTQYVDRKTGGGRFAADIIDEVKARGHEVVVLKEYDDGGEGVVALKRGYGMFACVPEVRRRLKDCDVIHAVDGYPFGVIAWLANRTLHKRLIISALGTYAVAPLYRFQTSFLLRRAYRAADKVVAISRFTRDEILKKIALPNLIVVTPGIQHRTYASSAVKEKRFIIGVGGVKERKGYHIALGAFAKVAGEFPDVSYVIVGDTDVAYRSILEKIISENHLEGRVTFMSGVTDEELARLYANAELFVLTPINGSGHHFEGFGLVYLEAARAGLPVIGTYGNGAEDALQQGSNGLLVAQGDVEATAAAIRAVIGDGRKRQDMSAESLKWAAAHTLEKEAEHLLRIYEGV